MGNIANGELNTFVDGQIVSANDATYGLNPKMEVIRAAVNDNDSRISVLEGQISASGQLFFNVKASPYNAVGDGIADDTLAIQAAITAASAVNGTVIIPYGDYKLTDALTVAGSCIITSDGTGNISTLRPSVADKAVFIINSSFVQITDLYFLINVDNTVSAVIYSNTATALAKYSGITIQKCTIYSTTSNVFHGIEFNFPSSATISECSIVNNYSGAINSNGITIYSGENCIIKSNNIYSRFYSILLTRQTGAVATYPQCLNNQITSNYLASVYTCVSLRETIDTSISQNYFKIYSASSTVYFVYIGAGTGTYVDTRTHVFENRFDGSSILGFSCAVYLYISKYALISNNEFIECGTNTLGAIYVNPDSSSVCFMGNTFFQPLYAGIYFGYTPLSTYLPSRVLDNTFVDVYNSVTGTYAILHDGAYKINVSGNTVIRGSKTASYINEIGLRISSITTNGNRVLFSGNNFTDATTSVSLATSTAICVFYEEPTGARVFRGTAIPASGTFKLGDKVILTSPTAGGYIGYVCTTAGTPGTWKGFGAIQV